MSGGIISKYYYVLGLWCLPPLSTIFHIVAVNVIGGGVPGENLP
jgi:hypothetical protein